MRNVRKTAYGAALLALVLTLGACGSGVSEDEPSGEGGGGSVASRLTLGGPPECPKRPFCLPGLEETYGVEFADFKPLDVGGPLTVKALENGQVDVGLLFSTSSAIIDKGFVVLEDDKGLQQAENITPLVRSDVLDGTITEQLNAVSAALDTETITELNGKVELDREDPADVAAEFLEQEGLLGGASGGSGDLTIGAVAFAENQIVAEMYAQVLEDAGYGVDRQTDLEVRDVLYSAVKSGDIDIAPEYLGSLLLFLDPQAEGSNDPQEEVDALVPLLNKDGLELLEPSEANDTNVFVVTQETADEYGLETVSDLAKEQ
jgi:glycine betaine/choline ABC-type transport system substrate-binding protein